EAMWNLLAPVDRARIGHDRFVGLHRQFATLLHVTGLEATSSQPHPAALPPEPRLPAPVATASPSGSASSAPRASPSASEQLVVAGPVAAMAGPVTLTFATTLLD